MTRKEIASQLGLLTASGIADRELRGPVGRHRAVTVSRAPREHLAAVIPSEMRVQLTSGYRCCSFPKQAVPANRCPPPSTVGRARSAGRPPLTRRDRTDSGVIW